MRLLLAAAVLVSALSPAFSAIPRDPFTSELKDGRRALQEELKKAIRELEARPPLYKVAECALYEGAYAKDKQPIYAVPVMAGDGAPPGVGLGFQKDGVQYLYQAGAALVEKEGRRFLAFVILLTGGAHQQPATEIVELEGGKPFEVALTDAVTGTTLRCHSHEAPRP